MKYLPDSAVEYIVWHYTATSGDVDRKTVRAWHKKRWKSPEMGYHYLYRLDGTEEVGRDLSKTGKWQQGAGVKGNNGKCIHLSYAGGIIDDPNVGHDTRTQEQIDAMVKRTKQLLERFPSAQVVGHRDLTPTQCPGFDVVLDWQKRSVEKPNPWTALIQAIAAAFSRRKS